LYRYIKVVTCVAPPSMDRSELGRLPGGAVTVEFCDLGMSCCSDPMPLAVPHRKMRPANFTPPSLARPYLAGLYRLNPV
jgi:hypothetical protein